MINERGLLSAMKKAYKEYGYEFYGYDLADEKRVIILTPYWLVDAARASVGNRVLALVVEHTGELPDGYAVRVSKKDGVQSVIGDMVLDTRDKNVRRSAIVKAPIRTPVTFRGYEVWQNIADLSVYILNTEYMQIVDSNLVHAETSENGGLVFDGLDWAVVMPVNTDGMKTYIDALERMQWVEGYKEETE